MSVAATCVSRIVVIVGVAVPEVLSPTCGMSSCAVAIFSPRIMPGVTRMTTTTSITNSKRTMGIHRWQACISFWRESLSPYVNQSALSTFCSLVSFHQLFLPGIGICVLSLPITDMKMCVYTSPALLSVRRPIPFSSSLLDLRGV